MPSSNFYFCLIPSRCCDPGPTISNQRHAAAAALVGLGARRLRAHPDGAVGAAAWASPCPPPKKIRRELIYHAGGPLAQRPRHSV
jgi:hypothetical protein